METTSKIFRRTCNQSLLFYIGILVAQTLVFIAFSSFICSHLGLIITLLSQVKYTDRFSETDKMELSDPHRHDVKK